MRTVRWWLVPWVSSFALVSLAVGIRGRYLSSIFFSRFLKSSQPTLVTSMPLSLLAARYLLLLLLLAAISCCFCYCRCQVHDWQADCIICGLSAFDAENMMLLGYVPR